MRDIIAVCRSSKKSRPRVAAVLDTYFWRIGDRTWRGKASEACLRRVLSDLKAVASKTTAVSVHDAKRQHTHQPPLLFVGSRKLFSDSGIVPISTASRPDNHGGTFQRDLLILRACAAFHDIGKGFRPFQDMIRGSLSNAPKTDGVRHEALSAVAATAYLTNEDIAKEVLQLKARYEKSRSDGEAIPHLRSKDSVGALVRLVAAHHISPVIKDGDLPNLRKKKDGKALPLPPVEFSWGGEPGFADFVHLMGDAKEALAGVSEAAFSAADLRLRIPFILADRIGSHRKQIRESECLLLANTKQDDAGTSLPADDLRQHTQRVMGACAPALRSCQRWAWPSLSGTQIAANAPETGPYAWQSAVVRHFAEAGQKKGGVFGVLMSGTGSGKTIAGLCALAAARPNARITTCLGLRSLTEQTAASYAELSGVPSQSVCRLMGGAANIIGKHDTIRRTLPQDAAVLSGDDMLFHDTEEDRHEHLKGVLTPDEIRALRAPLLVATVDHLMGIAVSKTGRGVPVMAGMRLLTSDLILDEIDQYDVTEIPALVRLARACGACGGNLLIMSATIRPSLGLALHDAYAQGRKEHALATGTSPDVICVAGSDVEGAVMTGSAADVLPVIKDKTTAGVQAAAVRRKALIIETRDDEEPSTKGALAAREITRMRERLRNDNFEEVEIFGVRKRVSVGLIRMTRIDHAAWVACHADEAAPDHFTVRLLLHANFPQAVRTHIEGTLATALTGKDKRAALARMLENARPEIREGVRTADKIEFLVVSSPVIETGNDLDFDWAIVDAPTQRCVVQTSGRVRRNRPGAVARENLAIFRRPWHTFAGRPLAKPGLEDFMGLTRKGLRLSADETARIPEVRFRFPAEIGVQDGEAVTSALVGNGAFCDGVEERAVKAMGRRMDTYFKDIAWQGFNLDYLACSDFRGGPESHTLIPALTTAGGVADEWAFLTADQTQSQISVDILQIPDAGWLFSDAEISAVLRAAKPFRRRCPAPMGVCPKTSGKPVLYDGKFGVLRKDPRRKTPAS